jgi:hypothetical protein
VIKVFKTSKNHLLLWNIKHLKEEVIEENCIGDNAARLTQQFTST